MNVSLCWGVCGSVSEQHIKARLVWRPHN